jgi:hypothetical protein
VSHTDFTHTPKKHVTKEQQEEEKKRGQAHIGGGSSPRENIFSRKIFKAPSAQPLFLFGLVAVVTLGPYKQKLFFPRFGWGAPPLIQSFLPKKSIDM